MPIHCEIISQDKVVYSGDVDEVVLPGIQGEFGVLPNHSPILSMLQYGVITIKKDHEEQYFTVAGGIAEVTPRQINILADASENVEEIDVQRAEEARKRAEVMLQEGSQTSKDNYASIQNALRRSRLRVDAVRRFRHGRKYRPQ